MSPAANRRELTRRDLAVLNQDLARPDRGRMLLEGVTFPDLIASVPYSGALQRVDFVNCDLTNLSFRKARFKPEPVVQDCSFVRVDWGDGEFLSGIAGVRFAHCEFRDVTFDTFSFNRCDWQAVHIESCRMEATDFRQSRLTDVTIHDLRLRRGHWSKNKYENVTITGSARTLVVTESEYRGFDVSALRMADSDLGDIPPSSDVRFPDFVDSFAVPRSDLPQIEAELQSALSSSALESYREMAAGFYAQFNIVDDSLFRRAPDLPDMETEPADVDIIMAALRRHRVVNTSGTVPS